MNYKNVQLFSLITVLLMTGLNLTGLKRFVVWPQITYGFQSNIDKSRKDYYDKALIEQQIRLSRKFWKFGTISESSFDISKEKEEKEEAKNEVMIFGNLSKFISKQGILDSLAHEPRIILMSVVMIPALAYKMNPHVLFSFLVCLLLFFISYYLARIMNLYTNLRFDYLYIFNLSFFVFLSLFMNGRMIFSFCAIICLMWTQFIQPKKWWKNILFALSSLLLSSVSSGVFAVIFAAILYFTMRAFAKKDFGRGIIYLLSAVIGAPIFLSGIIKNIAYYGNDIWAPIRMLSHGMGKYLISSWWAFLIIIAIGFFIYKKRKFFLIPRAPLDLYLLLSIGLLGGLFGYSTMTTVIPVFLVLMTVYFKKHIGAKISV